MLKGQAKHIDKEQGKIKHETKIEKRKRKFQLPKETSLAFQLAQILS